MTNKSRSKRESRKFKRSK